MNDKKFIIGIVIASILLLVGSVFFALKLGDTPEVKSVLGATAVVNDSNHDWGEIGISDGEVESIFVIKNEGTETLKLFNIETSCMCTKAQLKLGDKRSKFFGMHSKSSYVMEVSPGDETELLVIFDPNFHGPGGVGPITRTVSVETNDPDNSELTFNLSAQVIK